VPDNTLAYRSVALLYVQSPKTKNIVVATGFAYDEDRIITAGHFCISALEIQIFESHTQSINMKYYDHEMNIKRKYSLEISEMSKEQDICMLKKESHGLIPIKVIEDYSDAKIGDSVSVVGVPEGTAVGEFYGHVMALSYEGFGPINIKGTLVVSAPSTGGISGSPIILDRTGEVIGIIVMGHTFFDHLSYGINGDKLNKFIEEWK
jgi:S1-C subfamily serine protease